jgi:hypothetical protein
MSSHSAPLETFLARLYVDPSARANFRSNPRAAAKNAGLSDDEAATLENLDWIGLEMAARSFAKKRHQKSRPTWFSALKSRVLRFRFFRFLQ